MAMLDAKCTSCGAALKVDGALDAANCEHCGSAFIVEKAVRNFYGNEQAQQKAAQASGATGKAKFSLFCGLISCAIPLITSLIGITVVPSLPWNYDEESLLLFFACLGLLSILLSIVGIVFGSLARKETNALSDGYASAGLSCSKIGVVLSCIATPIFFILS